jgi:hypothetical protein
MANHIENVPIGPPGMGGTVITRSMADFREYRDVSVGNAHLLSLGARSSTDTESAVVCVNGWHEIVQIYRTSRCEHYRIEYSDTKAWTLSYCKARKYK